MSIKITDLSILYSKIDKISKNVDKNEKIFFNLLTRTIWWYYNCRKVEKDMLDG